MRLMKHIEDDLSFYDWRSLVLVLVLLITWAVVIASLLYAERQGEERHKSVEHKRVCYNKSSGSSGVLVVSH